MTPGPSKPTCTKCDDWGCRSCRDPFETAARAGGEQGVDETELLRAHIAELEHHIEAVRKARDEARLQLTVLQGLLEEHRLLGQAMVERLHSFIKSSGGGGL